jgi:hypothetical protein
MSEAIVFVIGAITGIFIISHFTKSRLDQVEQGSYEIHPNKESETDDSHNKVGRSNNRQHHNSRRMSNS